VTQAELNAIEAHFGVTKRATLTGSDDRDHVPRRRRIYRYHRYRNRRVGNEDHPLMKYLLWNGTPEGLG